MRPQESGPGRALVREEEELRGGRPSIEGTVVAIDPGADGALTMAMAVALRDELASCGAKPVMLRDPDEDPPPSARARAANEVGAGACVSIHLGSGGPDVAGPTCAYFGSANTHSPTGRLLAQLILEQLETEFGRTGRLQRLTGAMLRETRMPAVQVEPVFLTNAADVALSDGPEFADRVGRAAARGLRRFFSG